uniref:Uncharacterized protein n=1 Tax=Palpitomonas bilix TaxID=652834 RepID=A0A7S3LU13_9EUKA
MWYIYALPSPAQPSPHMEDWRTLSSLIPLSERRDPSCSLRVCVVAAYAFVLFKLAFSSLFYSALFMFLPPSPLYVHFFFMELARFSFAAPLTTTFQSNMLHNLPFTFRTLTPFFCPLRKGDQLTSCT